MRYRSGGDVDHQLELMLNQGLEFPDNFRCAMLEIQTTGETQTVEHNLGVVPNGFIVILIDGEATVWAQNVSSWTTTLLYLKASAPSLTVRLIVV